MRKGIVMEVDDPYLILLTPEGEFLRARKMDRLYSIGEEIDFFPVTDTITSKKINQFKSFFRLKTVWMSVAVVVICISSIIPVYQSNKAYAYMTIDASTSIEMGLNQNMQVVELKGFTKEAKQIISQLEDWKKKDAAEVTSIILTELKDEGHIPKTDPVVISTVKTDQLKETVTAKLEENIKSIKKMVDKNLVEVKTYTTTKEEMEKAENSGMPVGIYHQTKNQSAQKKKSKHPEQIKHKNSTSSGISADSSLLPGQVKKQEETTNNPSESNQNNKNESVSSQNNSNNSVVTKQNNGNQDSPAVHNENQNKEYVNQKQNGTNKTNKKENQNKNIHNNSNKKVEDKK